MAETYDTTNTNTKPRSKKVVSRTVCWLLVILALVLGGLAGYAYGKNVATSDSEEALQAKVSSLEDQIEKAKTSANSKISDTEADTAQDQETIDALKSENAALTKTVNDQTKKIADLEQQLEDANSTPANP